jgi:transcriptional regulator with XRE-family HTH domain
MTNKQKKTIGEQLKAIRLSEGLSQRKLAILMGLNENNCCSISRIEDGNFDSPELPRSFLEAMGYRFKEKYQYTILKPKVK